MKFHEVNSHQSTSGLRALVMVAKAADSGLDKPQRAVLDAIQRCLLNTGEILEDLAPITVDELSMQIQDSAASRQLIQQMIIISLADGPPSKPQSDLITDFTSALGVNEPAVKVTRHLMQGKRLRFRLGFYPRSNVRDYIAAQYRTQGGVLGVIKGLMGFRGLIENRDLANKFRALEGLPENTLGYQFFQHCRNNKLNFPGEKGGFPVGAVWHDFGHVLAGYDTSPEGEIQAASFQAGNRQNENAFFTMLFAILIHTSGINMAPMEMPIEKGRIGNGDLAGKMFTAWLRGTRTKVDLGADWDFWAYLKLPIDVARQRIGVRPVALA
jgi:ubiquinone biosynthesis protein Coq4